MPLFQIQLPEGGPLTLGTRDEAGQFPTALTVGGSLGDGAFGSVLLCTDEDSGEEYALKAIKVEGDAAFKHAFARLIKREVAALKRLNMLKGFKKEGDTLYLLMPRVKGKRLVDVLQDDAHRLDRNFYGQVLENEGNREKSKEAALLIKKCLKKLEELHKQGIAHMDTHAGNLLVDVDDDGEETITPIDFGLSVETQDRGFFDYDVNRLMMGIRPLCPTIDKELWRLYIQETLQYIREHKIETALKVLSYGIITIAAVHGLTVYQVARTMAWSLTKMLANEQLVKTLFVQLKLVEGLRCAPDHQTVKVPNGYGGEVEIEMDLGPQKRIALWLSRILPIAICADISACIYRNRESVDLLYRIVAAAVKCDTVAVYKILKEIDVEKGFNAMLLYFPLKRIPGFCSNVVEEHLTSTESLEEQCEKIASAPAVR